MAKRQRLHSDRTLPGLFDELLEASPTPGAPSAAAAAPGATLLAGGLAARLGTAAAAGLSAPLGPVVARPVPNKICFMSMGSGSSGNCYYVGDSQGGMLVDAGIDAAEVADALRRHGISMQQVRGVLLTHDHSDHMRCVYSLLRKHKHMALYCTPRALGGIMRRHSVSRRLKDYHVAIYKEIPFTVGNFTITAFETMHDGTDNAGFYIAHDDRALTIATDLGCISPRVDFYARQSDYLVIESNYDQEMLRTGPYPEYIKARIATDCGHMDNAATARFLAEAYSPRLRNVWLCHLSHENNTPELALSASRRALQERGLTVGGASDTPGDLTADIQLAALPRTGTSRLFTLRPLPTPTILNPNPSTS